MWNASSEEFVVVAAREIGKSPFIEEILSVEKLAMQIRDKTSDPVDPVDHFQKFMQHMTT